MELLMPKKNPPKESIKQIVNNKLCTGCGTCTNFCPKNLITMTISLQDGIFSPKIADNSCINCGLCYQVCPGYEVDFKDFNEYFLSTNKRHDLLGVVDQGYVGFSENFDIRYNSTSGGLVTQILINAMQKKIIDGVLVTKMSEVNPFLPEPFIARSPREIIEASKAKYCPVPVNIALKEIIASKSGERFAVVGLPCHIHGIRKAEKLDDTLKNKIVLHIGLFCGGSPSFSGTDFLFRSLNIEKNNVVKIDYRGQGWKGKLAIFLKNGNTISIPYPDYWGNFGSFFYPSRCTLCSDWTSELSDISFGDAWIKDIMDNDKIGTSILIVRNQKCRDIIKEILSLKNINYNFIDSETIVNSQKGIFWKKRQIVARLNLMKIIGNSVPTDKQIFLKPHLKEYFIACYNYVLMYIAANKKIWFILDFYLYILKTLRTIRKKIIS